MVRVIGVDIPDNKPLEFSLRYIFGVGETRSKEICKDLRLDPTMRAKTLTHEQVAQIATHIQGRYVLEGNLRRKIREDISRLTDIKSYRGQRHRLGLPVRGQRTSTNARTRKGKRKSVANKK